MTGIQSRAYQDERDIDAITQFLLETYALTDDLSNWEPRRWIGNIYHRAEIEKEKLLAKLSRQVHIWQDSSGAIRGVVIPEYDGGAYLQSHPDYRNIDIEMVEWAESNLVKKDDEGKNWLHIHAYEDDSHRMSLLKERGYEMQDWYEISRRNRLQENDILDVSLAEGYVLRTIRNRAEDWQGLADLLNAAFNRTIHTQDEIRNFMTSPYYQDNLNFIVESPVGEAVAHAGFTMHEAESFAVLEPVCTHPQHQSKGLAKVAIVAGLKQLKASGIASVYVGTGSGNDGANHVYHKLGFTEARHLRCFRGTFAKTLSEK